MPEGCLKQEEEEEVGQKGEKPGFCIHKYSLSRNKPFIKVVESHLLSKHRANYI